MLNIPMELAPHERDNRLAMNDGNISDIAAAIEYLKRQKHLTTVSISDNVEMPQWEGMPGGRALALALAGCNSPNLLEAGIVGGDYSSILTAKCDANRRNATQLLKLAKNPTSALSKSECERITECLPAIVVIASPTGPHAGRDAMSTHRLVDVLERIASHAAQHNVDTGVDAYIQHFRPPVLVNAASATRAEGALGKSGAISALGS